MRSQVFFIMALTTSFLGVVNASSAHARLAASDPTAGAILQKSPTTISLTFSEELEPAFSHLTATDLSGQSVQLEAEEVGGDNGAELTARPANSLPSGRYNVQWQVLSKDGHKTLGATMFVVAP
jgi:methionine-rich copper-binding protein CopC